MHDHAGRPRCARQLHLNLFFHSRGHHEASWRHPDSSPLPLTDIRYYQDLARKAEAAKFDSIFLADQLALGEDAAQAARTWLEPITVLAALAVVDQPYRSDRDLLDDLYRAVQPGAAVRLDRPYQQRARRLEHRDLVAGDGGAQFRRRRPGQPRGPLCPRRGIHDRRQGAVGQLGRGRGARRPRRRTLRAAGPHPSDQPPRPVLPGRRAAQHAALSAGPAGAGAGGLVRHRPPFRGAACRGRVHRAYGKARRRKPSTPI